MGSENSKSQSDDNTAVPPLPSDFFLRVQRGEDDQRPPLSVVDAFEMDGLEMSIVSATMSDELLRFLQQCPEFSNDVIAQPEQQDCENSTAPDTSDDDIDLLPEGLTCDSKKTRTDRMEAMMQLGYCPCRDEAHPPGHMYFEGYFHGLSSVAAPVKSMNPRYGSTMEKPPAPLPLRAFLAAFRALNQKWVASVLDELREAGIAGPGGTAVLDADVLFADVAAQSHHGSPLPIQTNFRGRGWHIDGANSLLHMAISLRGRRTLHYSGDTVHHQQADMSAGDVYLTSPALFIHAVEFPPCDWQSRTLALQCRILVDDETRDSLYENYAMNAGAVATAIANVLSSATFGPSPLCLPTLEDVERVLQFYSPSSSSVATISP